MHIISVGQIVEGLLSIFRGVYLIGDALVEPFVLLARGRFRLVRHFLGDTLFILHEVLWFLIDNSSFVFWIATLILAYTTLLSFQTRWTIVPSPRPSIVKAASIMSKTVLVATAVLQVIFGGQIMFEIMALVQHFVLQPIINVSSVVALGCGAWYILGLPRIRIEMRTAAAGGSG